VKPAHANTSDNASSRDFHSAIVKTPESHGSTRGHAGAGLARSAAVITLSSFRTFVRTCVAGFAALAGLAPIASSSTDAATLEYKVKAGYLFNFARFIQWPEAAFVAPDSPFVIGVLDAQEAVAVVESVLDARLIDGRPIAVRAVTPEQIASGVHILLVTRAARKTAEEVTALVGARPTLLVGETDFFAERGGMLGFTHDGEAIRISLNIERALEVGLKVSSKLASVAQVVRSSRRTAARP
jgi:hypothetical protein